MRLAALCLLSLAACASSSDVEDFLGPARLDLLANAERVRSYRVDGAYDSPLRDDEAVPRIAGWPLLAAGPDLSDAQVERFRALVRDPGSYLFDVAKGCEFAPGVSIRFERGTSSLDVLLCFSCDEWDFSLDGDPVEGGRRVMEDFDPVRRELVALCQELFPDDPAIAGLR